MVKSWCCDNIVSRSAWLILQVWKVPDTSCFLYFDTLACDSFGFATSCAIATVDTSWKCNHFDTLSPEIFPFALEMVPHTSKN